nr:MAG TPA: hypothetical protein [Caudoviricetes sp.]
MLNIFLSNNLGFTSLYKCFLFSYFIVSDLQ